MRPEAEKILEVFREKGVEPGGFITWADFSEDVVRFEGGFMADEGTRKGFIELRDAEMIYELAAAVELTERGQRYMDEHIA